MVECEVHRPRNGHRRSIVWSALSELVFATYLAPALRPLYERVAAAAGGSLVTGESFDQLRDVDFAFLCGYPYVRLRSEGMPLEAFAAPVVEGDRYGGRPIYFSDVIVGVNSAAASFGDLRGCRWAYNDHDSHSGYLVTLHRLAMMGESSDFFSRWVQAGFHQRSIEMVARGEVDASAIDSHVLALANPNLTARVRVIDALGPSTIQPLVATSRADDRTKAVVRDITTGIRAPESLVERFVAVDDSAYDDIRGMLSAVRSAGLI